MMLVVSDTSPISNLLSIGRIDILERVFGRVLIPPAVASELLIAHDQIPEFIQTQPINTSIHIEAANHLDPGEVEAIQLTLNLGAEVLIIDDKEGRKVAIAEEIKCMGTLGVLVAAKLLGHLKQVAPVLDELKANRFHFSDSVKRQVLAQVSEVV